MRIEGMRRLVFAGTRAGREARTGTAARASGEWPRRGWFVVLGVYLLVFLSSLVWRWIPVDQSLVGQAAMAPLSLVAAVLAWQASRRVRGSRHEDGWASDPGVHSLLWALQGTQAGRSR